MRQVPRFDSAPITAAADRRAQRFLHSRSNVRGRSHHVDPCRFQRRHFFRGSSLATCDYCAGMAHATSRRRCLSGNESDNWFGDVLFRECRCFFFSRAANLPNHDYSVCFRIILKQSERIHMRGTNNRIATDTDR